MSVAITTVAVSDEQDVVHARQRARLIASLVGFERTDQTRFSTAVSEIARNAYQYAGGGAVTFLLELEGTHQALAATVRDSGPGLPDLGAVLEGRHTSRTGLGLGIVGTRRLMDSFTIEPASGGGTVVSFAKALPPSMPRLAEADAPRIADVLTLTPAESPLEEVRLQNHELLSALDELRERQAQLVKVHAELEDTNRGVLALYSELDEKARQLALANAQEARFLSHVSHEFRTPLSSIIALARLLLDRVDGELTEEQVKQVTFIRDGATYLSSLVDDLLDLAKIEAGKTVVHPRVCTVADLFSALRGMLRPTLTNDAVDLVFEDVGADVPELFTDDGKVAQILRNLLSNAFKFTEAGEIRVSASLRTDEDSVELRVSDTGIGVAPEDQERIFDEYAQLERRRGAAPKGTGLGLPICRRLAELLGGRVGVESRPGEGSTFWAVIPVRYQEPAAQEAEPPGGVGAAASPSVPTDTTGAERGDGAAPITLLIVDDDAAARYALRSHLGDGTYRVLETADGREAVRLARAESPDCIFLDLMMPGMDGFEVLHALRADAATRDIPVIVVTACVLDDHERRQLDAATVAVLAKEAPTRDDARAAVDQALHQALAVRHTKERSHG